MGNNDDKCPQCGMSLTGAIKHWCNLNEPTSAAPSECLYCTYQPDGPCLRHSKPAPSAYKHVPLTTSGSLSEPAPQGEVRGFDPPDASTSSEYRDLYSAYAAAIAERDEMADENMKLRCMKDPEIVDSVKAVALAHLKQVVQRLRASRDELTEERDTLRRELADREREVESMLFNRNHYCKQMQIAQQERDAARAEVERWKERIKVVAAGSVLYEKEVDTLRAALERIAEMEPRPQCIYCAKIARAALEGEK